jgi:hypothetical protein
MKLYHGTTEAIARKALTEGLLPRNRTGHTGNWDHTVPAADNRIYLTLGYAPYFASCAAEELNSSNKWGLVEIDTDKLGYHPMGTKRPVYLPDEDWLEQITRSASLEQMQAWDASTERDQMLEAMEGFPWDAGMEERTSWFRDNILRFAHMADRSLNGLGSCSVLNGVSPSAITRVAVYDPDSNPTMTMCAMDPMISTMNWSMCETKYIEITRWFMGYDDIDHGKIVRLGSFDEGGEERARKLKEGLRGYLLKEVIGIERCQDPECVSCEANRDLHNPESRLGIQARTIREFEGSVDDMIKIAMDTFDNCDCGEYRHCGEVKEDVLNAIEGMRTQLQFADQEAERTKAWNTEVIPARQGIEVIQPSQFGTGDCPPPVLKKDAVLEAFVLEQIIEDVYNSGSLGSSGKGDSAGSAKAANKAGTIDDMKASLAKQIVENEGVDLPTAQRLVDGFYKDVWKKWTDIWEDAEKKAISRKAKSK